MVVGDTTNDTCSRRHVVGFRGCFEAVTVEGGGLGDQLREAVIDSRCLSCHYPSPPPPTPSRRHSLELPRDQVAFPSA